MSVGQHSGVETMAKEEGQKLVCYMCGVFIAFSSNIPLTISVHA